MVTKTVELSEAQDRLVDLVAQAATGTEIVLTEGNTSRARLVALPAQAAQRAPGLQIRESIAGRLRMTQLRQDAATEIIW
jgi:antitoxin (DNA-binding transcriptional repressor) of toxin-antitoxin stability system